MFFRRTKFGAALWIDAICINQSDLREKSRQIRIMPDIYFRAKTVLVRLDVPQTIVDDLYQLLSENEYWQRLRVIQEIGKAAVLQVGFHARMS